MKNKNADLLSKGLAVTGVLALVSSFFVKDNEKAVNRRWSSLGLFVASYGVELLGKTAKKA